MKRKHPIAIAGGLGCRIISDVMAAIAKQDATKDIPGDFHIWAWDTDSRGIRDLTRGREHAPPCCTQPLHRSVGARPSTSLTILAEHSTRDAPCLAIASLTSEGTFKPFLELIAETTDLRFLLLVLVDSPQEEDRISSYKKRTNDGWDALRSVAGLSHIHSVILHRDAFLALDNANPNPGLLSDPAKELFMRAIDHVLWLLLTSEKYPDTFIELWNAASPADGRHATLGHLQIDTAAKPIKHTLQATAKPDPLSYNKATYTIHRWNRLTSLEPAPTPEVPLALVYCDQEKVGADVDGASKMIRRESYLVQRLDAIVVERIPLPDPPAPADSSPTGAYPPT